MSVVPKKCIDLLSQPISRVLSRTVIHLGQASPRASCDLPVSCAGHAIGNLFGLAPNGVCPATIVTNSAVCSYHTLSPLPYSKKDPKAVYFLRHFPWARAPQALPGVLPCGARTFLWDILIDKMLSKLTPQRLPSRLKLKFNTINW